MVVVAAAAAWCERVEIYGTLEKGGRDEEDEDEDEGEAVFISVVNTRRRLSLLVKIEGDPLNTQHAPCDTPHRSVQATGAMSA